MTGKPVMSSFVALTPRQICKIWRGSNQSACRLIVPLLPLGNSGVSASGVRWVVGGCICIVPVSEVRSPATLFFYIRTIRGRFGGFFLSKLLAQSQTAIFWKGMTGKPVMSSFVALTPHQICKIWWGSNQSVCRLIVPLLPLGNSGVSASGARWIDAQRS